MSRRRDVSSVSYGSGDHPAAPTTDPTTNTYRTLNEAFEFFNERLFNGALPTCLITLQRKSRWKGFFSPAKFVSGTGAAACDEIALNPRYFQERGTKLVLSTLVHEMVHLWQHHYGRPGRNGYHNRQWADQMLQLGLVPHAAGRASGRQTGQRVTHDIATGGPFELACDEFMRRGFHVPYVENVPDVASGDRKAASKTRFTCDGCGQHAWAKPTSALMCGACERPLAATNV